MRQSVTWTSQQNLSPFPGHYINHIFFLEIVRSIWQMNLYRRQVFQTTSYIHIEHI